MANRNFNDMQSLERQLKKINFEAAYVAAVTASGTLDLTSDITVTSTTAGSTTPNGSTLTVDVNAAAANPTDTVLAVVTGTAAATVITITPNDGTNNVTPAVAATGSIATTTPIALTATVAGTAVNTNTLTIQVEAAAANPTDTILAVVSGTEAAAVLTITPNDGTNNGATPVDLTTAELAELINSNTVVGKTVTLTDASSWLDNYAATGGDATALADSGEGDGVTGTLTGGVDAIAVAVNVTTAQLRELIATGDIAALTVTLTDASSLLDEFTATGGDATALANGGEGDGEVATLSGGVAQDFTLTRNYGIYDITQTATGEYKIELEDKYNALNFAHFIIVGSTARDFTFQIKEYSVNPTSGRAYITIYALTGGTETQLNDGDILLGEFTLKNTSVI